MESILNALTCHLSPRLHLYDNPKVLPCCQRIACNKCILKCLEKSSQSNSHGYHVFECPYCNISSKIGLSRDGTNECDLAKDHIIEKELDTHLTELNHFLVKRVEHSLANLDDRLESIEKLLSKRKKFFENEIHEQVAALKAHLDQLETSMIEKLEKSSENMSKNIEIFKIGQQKTIEDIKRSTVTLKSNAFGYANNYDTKSETKSKNAQKNVTLVDQHESVQKCITHLNEINDINSTFSDMVGELRFEPNHEFPSRSIIGYIKRIEEINLKEQFRTIKNQKNVSKITSTDGKHKYPISPRFLCILDAFNLLVTDSQSKNLLQLSLETGEYIRSTNLNGQFKSPDGVCVNPSTGDIYVSDSEIKVIFKLDSELNLIKKFAGKDLKWPRGLTYDFDVHCSSDDMSPNRLYVCDYSNQKVAIFNEHDQLRDFLEISVMDEHVPCFNKTVIENEYPIDNSEPNVNLDDAVKFCPLNVLVNKKCKKFMLFFLFNVYF
jgi:hypothetical protein